MPVEGGGGENWKDRGNETVAAESRVLTPSWGAISGDEGWLSQTVGLALDCLQQFLLEGTVGWVERHTHALAAGRSHRERVHVAHCDDIQGDAQV